MEQIPLTRSAEAWTCASWPTSDFWVSGGSENMFRYIQPPYRSGWTTESQWKHGQPCTPLNEWSEFKSKMRMVELNAVRWTFCWL